MKIKEKKKNALPSTISSPPAQEVAEYEELVDRDGNPVEDCDGEPVVALVTP